MATVFDNIKGIFSRQVATTETKMSAMVGYFGIGSGEGKQYAYEDLAREGYMKNAIVYRCVNEISKGASSVPFVVKVNDTVLEQHPLIDLLNRPNPLQSYSEFFASLFGYLMLSGNAYTLKVGGVSGQPRELHLLRPDRIKIEGGSGAIPLRYDYMLRGRVEASYEVDQETGFSDLKQTKLWNPMDDFYGCSPLSAAAVEVDQHNLSSKHNINLLNNGARPSGAVVFKPKDESGFHANLTESQRQQLLTDLNNRFGGTNNAGRPLLLEGDFDWKEMGLSPRDMDFINLKHMSATDIAMCFGVPSQLVGVPDAQTYANVAEARLALYEETIIPHLRKVESDLNEWLVAQFDERLHFQYVIDEIPALSERRRRIYENVVSAVNAGIMTRNEARELVGLSPLRGADDLLVPATLFPLGASGAPPSDNGNEADAEELEDPDDDESDDDEEKALSDIDLKPTSGMADEARKGLEWRREFNRGGTMVGVARANQLVARERLSVSTVRRMYSFFSRHEVDKQAEGFRQGEDGYPSAGRIAWALWGGDAGFSWSKKKRDQIEREMEKATEHNVHVNVTEPEETKAPTVSGAVRKGLQNKVDKHNEKYGDNPTKRATLRMLISCFRRGIGAYRTNPQSVRPSVRSEDQWAYARVNAFLYALRNGRFRSGKFDQDLFPKGHPLSSKK